MHCKLPAVDMCNVIGDDSLRGGGDTNGPQFGWVLLVFVEAKEVGISEVGEDTTLKMAIVDLAEEGADRKVDVQTLALDEADKGVGGDGKQPAGSPSVWKQTELMMLPGRS